MVCDPTSFVAVDRAAVHDSNGPVVVRLRLANQFFDLVGFRHGGRPWTFATSPSLGNSFNRWMSVSSTLGLKISHGDSGREKKRS